MINVRKLSSIVLLLVCAIAHGQKKPNNFILGTYPATSPAVSYSIKGFGNDFSSTSTFTLQYGRESATATGINRVVKLFQVEGEPYSFAKSVAGTKPFKKVITQRNSSVVKTTALFETSSSANTTNGTTTYLSPDYVGTMEDLLNSYVINRGTDNVFINSGTTSNNIERFDIIMETPVNISNFNPNTSGFLMMERGGNDIFKVAAITGLSGDAVTQYKTPVTVAASNWGNTNQAIQSIVMQRLVGTDADLKPSQFIGSQPISGVFVTLAQLGLTSGTLYGISLFGGDVTLTNSELLTIAKYPTNTAESDGNGLDFMAGGGFFVRAILIKGLVWNDIDGNAIKDSNEPGMANNLWANLVDPSGKVVSSMQVAADGTYTVYVASNNVVTGDYKVVLTNTEKYEGTQLTIADNLGNGYAHTGTNYKNTANKNNKAGQIIIGGIADVDIENINFGIRSIALPITLGNFTAAINNNHLLVNWQSVTETDNAYFDIEVATDGTTFKKVGTVLSKAVDGNADNRIDYSFTVDLQQQGLLFLSILPLGLLALLIRKKRERYFRPLIAFSITVIAIAGCTKNEKSIGENNSKIFIRLKQVDKAGEYHYSKIIQAVS